MLTKTESLSILRTFFKKNYLATMPILFSLLQTTSRMSVFRRLQELEYVSSYTHAGRYYTLPSMTYFDRQGLWYYDNVGFSKNGSLKNTVKYQIEHAQAGKIHDELEAQLSVRVHNTLLDLVRSNQISRESFQGTFLYLSSDPVTAKAQIEHREHLSVSGVIDVLPDWLLIELLAEIIRSHHLTVDAQKVAMALGVKQIAITAEQVTQALLQLGVKKTPDLRS